MDSNQLKELLADLESDRVERKESISDKKKICQAICAFANDLPEHRLPGYVFVGVNDGGVPVGLENIEKNLMNLANIRSDGNILPLPRMNVQKRRFDGKEVAVVEVFSHDSPPVRYEGRVWVRIGSRRAVASRDEERQLSEKRVHGSLSFDQTPFKPATINDLDVNFFLNDYLPSAVAPEDLEENNRTPEEQLCSSRFLSLPGGIPTVAGLLVAGKDPQFWIPGAYIQYVRFEGVELLDPIKDQREIRGPLLQQLRQLDELLKLNIMTATLIPDSGPEIRNPDYPLEALQQLARNAVLHRNYETGNAPVKLYWYSDKIEITNPGGLFGGVNESNFETSNDYRNPELAEVMKVFGFVQRFGVGIRKAKRALERNGNPPPKFEFNSAYSSVTIYKKR